MRLTFVFFPYARVWVQHALCSASESFLCTFMIIIIVITAVVVVVGMLVGLVVVKPKLSHATI